jgi:hypothetical protein
MPSNAQLSVEIRTAIIVMRYYRKKKHKEIAEELNLKPGTVRMTCQRIAKATGSTNLLDLLQHCGHGIHSGRPLKVKPGSEEANEIRTAVKKHKYQFPEEVASWVLQQRQQRQPLGEISTNIAASTTRKILRDPKYIANDPINVKEIIRKRELQKNRLTKEHCEKREAYCNQIDQWYSQNALIITCDEYKEHFGGSGLKRVTIDRGVDSYSAQEPIRFAREQWAASSDDPTVQRPYCIWEAEKATNHVDWHYKLQEAKQVLEKEVRLRRSRCSKEGTTEYYLLHKKN